MTNLLNKVAQIYTWLDDQIASQPEGEKGSCRACGKCCDFDKFDHRLFVTTPELMYFKSKLENVIARSFALSLPKGETMKQSPFLPMQNGVCPYNKNGKCSVYDIRFAGCRIFACQGDSDFQSELSEIVILKFKTLCTEFDLDYRYMDLKTALGNA